MPKNKVRVSPAPGFNSKGNRRGMHPNSHPNMAPRPSGLNSKGNWRGMQAKHVGNPHPEPHLENIIPHQWKPGQTGNPQNISLTRRLELMLNQPLKKPTREALAADHVVYATIKGAIAGRAAQVEEVWNRHDGRVPQPVTGADGEALTLIDNRRLIVNILGDPAGREAALALLRALESRTSGNGSEVESRAVAKVATP